MFIRCLIHVAHIIWLILNISLKRTKRTDFVGLLATRFVRLAQKIVCSSHPIYRLVRKPRVRMVTVGFILVLLIQRVYDWAGLGISLLWFHRLLMFLDLACWRWLLCLGMAASARLSTHYLGVACCALDSQRVRPCGLREASPFSD